MLAVNAAVIAPMGKEWEEKLAAGIPTSVKGHLKTLEY